MDMSMWRWLSVPVQKKIAKGAESRKDLFIGLLQWNGRRKTCTVANRKKPAKRWNEPSQDEG